MPNVMNAPNPHERNPRKALGKGLSALLPTRPSVSAPEPAPAHEEFQNIPLDRIEPGEQQPRDSFDEEKLMELAQSIRANGLIQPITVAASSFGKFRIIAGERRWRAAQIAGLTEIPALVRNVAQHQHLELALIENIQREDLNPIEIATAFYRLADEHGLSHEQIAERTGKDRSTVTNLLRLLRLGPRVKEALIAGTISMGHARALLNISDYEAQAHACNDIVAKQLSVRDTEALVKHVTQPAPEPAQIKEKKGGAAQIDPNERAALDEMAMALGTRVRLVKRSPTSGRLEIEYYSQDDLDRIYSVIVKP
ncbi:MAG TPA: ParB/RepB/Spo0J family partition protein [Bryobacteraceae bacterium]|jgi:ParB family chromosome partitioning protein